MAGITVTPEQLQEISTRLVSGASEIEGILSQLANVVSPLHSEWVGAAQAQFENLWSQWQRDATGLHEALQGVAQLTAAASQSYAQTESSIASSFGKA
ncbi:MAG TPA: WXG100 family type VII secretion target [Acidimicrobiales bacterium]|jgi:WXG100 family type VII secretion target|nr:WXG100 family type VII secretion target [Acidimicrobiales bacterium]